MIVESFMQKALREWCCISIIIEALSLRSPECISTLLDLLVSKNCFSLSAFRGRGEVAGCKSNVCRGRVFCWLRNFLSLIVNYCYKNENTVIKYPENQNHFEKSPCSMSWKIDFFVVFEDVVLQETKSNVWSLRLRTDHAWESYKSAFWRGVNKSFCKNVIHYIRKVILKTWAHIPLSKSPDQLVSVRRA